MHIPDGLDAHQSIRERFEESMRAAAATLANSSLLDSSLDDSDTVYSDASEVPSLASVDDYGSTYDTSEPEGYQGEMFGNEHLSLMLSRIIQILWSLFGSVMRTVDTSDTGVYEATSSVDDILLDTVTQVNFSSFVNVFFCMATQFVY